jgi:hypothetical protein
MRWPSIHRPKPDCLVFQCLVFQCLVFQCLVFQCLVVHCRKSSDTSRGCRGDDSAGGKWASAAVALTSSGIENLKDVSFADDVTSILPPWARAISDAI